MHLGRTTTGDQSTLLDQASNDTEGVVETSLALLEHQRVGTRAEDADRLAHVLDARDLADTRAALLNLIDQVGTGELVLGERLNVSDGLGADGLGDKLNLVTLNVLDDKNLELGKEVKGELVDSVTENRLLNQEHVASRLLDLLAHVEQVLALLLENLVHLAVVVDHDLVVHVGLGAAELELADGNLGLLHARRPTAAGDHVLLEHETLDKLSVIDGTTDLLDDANVAEIDSVDVHLGWAGTRAAEGCRRCTGSRVGSSRIATGGALGGAGGSGQEPGDGIYSDWRENGRVLGDNLKIEGVEQRCQH